MTVEVGVRVPRGLFAEGPDAVGRFARRAEALGLDRLWVGDHVSFRGGQGYDGLLQLAAVAAHTTTIRLQTAVYLLILRHPVPVARQVASLAEMAPGRVVLGVGLGGDDAAELVNCGVDPATRGRRLDESLTIMRALLHGDVVDHSGPFFDVSDCIIRPVARPAVPIVIGGRSAAALRRTGRLGDGWIAVFVDPERFSLGLAEVDRAATAAGRSGAASDHALVAWCGFGDTSASVRPALASAMEGLYRMPFERFERYSPYGTPADVADALRPYAAAGARSLLLGAVAATPDEIVEGASEVRRLLTSSGSGCARPTAGDPHE